jgi:hypothetical protein
MEFTFFWKDVIKNYFPTLLNFDYIKRKDYKSLVKMALTRNKHQCQNCKFFCTIEIDRLICLIDSKLIIYVFCEICQTEQKIIK